MDPEVTTELASELTTKLPFLRIVEGVLYWIIIVAYFPLLWKSVSALRRRAPKIPYAMWILLANAGIVFVMSMADMMNALFSVFELALVGLTDPIQLMAFHESAYPILSLMCVSVFHLLTFVLLFVVFAARCRKHENS